MLSAAETSRPLVVHGRGGEQWRQWVEGELLGGGPDVEGTEPGSAACGFNSTTVGVEEGTIGGGVFRAWIEGGGSSTVKVSAASGSCR
jgi:hypothetical protein